MAKKIAHLGIFSPLFSTFFLNFASDVKRRYLYFLLSDFANFFFQISIQFFQRYL